MSFTHIGKGGRVAAGALGLLAFAGLAAACGGFGAGDYAVYRVASPEAKLSGDCQNDPDHKSTFQDGSTFVLYAVSSDGEDTFYLDVGTTVLSGETTDDGYAFSGKSTDVQENGGFTITQTTTVNVTLVDEGDTVSGTYVAVQETSCSGTGCDFVDTGKCTSSSTFVGVLVDDSALTANPGQG